MKPLTLITGGTGFVGRHVLRLAIDAGVPLRVIARPDRREALPHGLPAHAVIETPNLFAETADWWQRTCAGVDTIIHLAWHTEPATYLTSPLNLECLQGTCALARGAAGANTRRFVGIGTCFEYEISTDPISEHTRLLPATPYSAAKAAAFLALSTYMPTVGIEFAWCRLFYLHGEGENPSRLVPYIRQKLSANQPVELSAGDQIRDFLHVKEAARRIFEVASSSRQGPVNVCSGRPTTVRELAESIADEYGKRHLLKFGARPPNLFDPPKIVGVPS